MHDGDDYSCMMVMMMAKKERKRVWLRNLVRRPTSEKQVRAHTLITQVFGSAEMRQHCPLIARTKEAAGKDDGVKGNVIFAHELEQFHIFGVFPPLFPVRSVVGSNGNVPYRSIKPNIKHLMVSTMQSK